MKLTGRGTERDPVRVKSEAVTIQEFWLQRANGAEQKITLHKVPCCFAIETFF
jgi:hypothetical protein